MTNISIIVVSR